MREASTQLGSSVKLPRSPRDANTRREESAVKTTRVAVRKASRPTIDWDPRYNTPGAFWTADQFVEAAYKSLTQSKATN